MMSKSQGDFTEFNYGMIKDEIDRAAEAKGLRKLNDAEVRAVTMAMEKAGQVVLRDNGMVVFVG